MCYWCYMISWPAMYRSHQREVSYLPVQSIYHQPTPPLYIFAGYITLHHFRQRLTWTLEDLVTFVAAVANKERHVLYNGHGGNLHLSHITQPFPFNTISHGKSFDAWASPPNQMWDFPRLNRKKHNFYWIVLSIELKSLGFHEERDVLDGIAMHFPSTNLIWSSPGRKWHGSIRFL